MRAEDAIEVLVQIETDLTAVETLADAMLHEGIAYDELARFMMLGPWRAKKLMQEVAPGPRSEMEFQGRLWLDGYLVGRRVGLAQGHDRPPR